MTVVRHHAPALHEGVCEVCTTEYRTAPEFFMSLGIVGGPTIDEYVCRWFREWHRDEGHK